jgi:hypothetical protein
LAFRAGEGRKDVVSFARAGSQAVFWSVQVTRGVGPKLEIHTPGGRALSADERARVLEMLNAHSRAVLVEGDRLRIGFGAVVAAHRPLPRRQRGPPRAAGPLPSSVLEIFGTRSSRHGQ